MQAHDHLTTEDWPAILSNGINNFNTVCSHIGKPEVAVDSHRSNEMDNLIFIQHFLDVSP